MCGQLMNACNLSITNAACSLTDQDAYCMHSVHWLLTPPFLHKHEKNKQLYKIPQIRLKNKWKAVNSVSR